MLPIKPQHSASGNGVVGSHDNVHPITGKLLAGHFWVDNPARKIGNVVMPQSGSQPSPTPPQARGRGAIYNVAEISNPEGNRADSKRSTPQQNKQAYGATPLQEEIGYIPSTVNGPGNYNNPLPGTGPAQGVDDLPNWDGNMADALRATPAANADYYNGVTSKPLAGAHLSSSVNMSVIHPTDVYTKTTPVVTPTIWSAENVSLWLGIAASVAVVIAFTFGRTKL